MWYKSQDECYIKLDKFISILTEYDDVMETYRINGETSDNIFMIEHGFKNEEEAERFLDYLMNAMTMDATLRSYDNVKSYLADLKK